MPTQPIPFSELLDLVETYHRKIHEGWRAPGVNPGQPNALHAVAIEYGRAGDKRGAEWVLRRISSAHALGVTVEGWRLPVDAELRANLVPRYTVSDADYRAWAALSPEAPIKAMVPVQPEEDAPGAKPEKPEPPGMRNGVPLSEDQRKFREEWTAADCVAELQRIANLDTTRVVTRNYFRVHSDISESTWNRYFGTFLEFKRQAEIILSRHAHRLERDIAKHASVDKMRVLNTEKREFEGKYLRPSGRAFQVTITVSDLHGKHCDPFFRRVFLDMLRRIRPDKVVLDGDVVDFSEFSKHTKDPRDFDVTGEIEWLHSLLADIRAAVPDAEIIYIEGNHEFRLMRHMGESTPALMVVLSDLHGFTVPKLLGLDRFEVNYIARMDMTAWTERDIKKELRKNYVTLFDSSLLFGHFPEMRSMGIPGANGHHHKHIVWPAYSPVYGPHEWHQIGCGHMREASYCNGERWSNGLLISYTHVATKRTQFEYVDLSHQAAMVGGLFYERSADEPVLDLIRESRP